MIFVVDSADVERLDIARQELHALLAEEELKDAILLVMSNKSDLRGALPVSQIAERLDLASIKNRQWTIQETSATRGRGLFEGFDWLVTCITAKSG